MTITDEMVEKAIQAAEIHSTTFNQFRAALEAVAPMLIAQGMREAAEICDDGWESAVGARHAILARAEELDPK